VLVLRQPDTAGLSHVRQLIQSLNLGHQAPELAVTGVKT